MRAMPRTWPSIRLRRLAQDALMSLRMRAIYPHRVSDSTLEERRMAHASAPPTHLGSSSGSSGHPDAAPDNALTHDHCHHAGDARTPPTPPPVLALEMGGHLTNLHMLLDQNWSNWLQFILA